MSVSAGAVDEGSHDFSISGRFSGEDVVEDLVELVKEETARTEAEAADILFG